jgi:hypothetical protein
MADWTVKDLAEVDAHDHVMTWTPGGRLLPGKVVGRRRELVHEYHELGLSDGGLEVTGRHPFEADWNVKIRVEDMDEGQKLRAYDKGWDFERVVSNEIVTSEQGVWVNNIEVETWHRYLVRRKGTRKWKAVYNRKADPGTE